jgi:hypothetical protein
MADIFTLENVSNFSEKLNIDDLYERKKQYDLGKLELYNKILNRIHVRIKTTAKQKIDEKFCWFVVPEVILGVPKYDQPGCIAYLLDKLQDNGFKVKYIHPNTLLIVWAHFVPSYIRTELKNKTGIIIDEYGKIENKDNNEKEYHNDYKNSDTKLFSEMSNSKVGPQKKYTPINTYKPQGNLIYEDTEINSLFRPK